MRQNKNPVQGASSTPLEAKGFVQIAGYELLHQLRRDTPYLYDWFADQARAHIKNGSVEEYGRRLQVQAYPADSRTP